MELLIIGLLAIFIITWGFSLIKKENEPKRLLTYVQGQELAQQIELTEQTQKKISKELRKSNERLIQRVEEFGLIDKKRYEKLRDIQSILMSIDARFKEKGKYKITEEQAFEQLNSLEDDFKELEEVEQEFNKLKKKDTYQMKI